MAKTLLGSPQMEFNTYTGSDGPAAHPWKELHPKRGVVIGGGAWVDFSDGAGNMLTAIYPDTARNRWVAKSKDHLDANPAVLHAWCITAQVDPRDVYVARGANAHHTG